MAINQFKIQFTLFVGIFFFGSIYSQDTDRKKQFYFEIGPEFRVTPIYRANFLNREAFFTNPDKQNSGIALNLGVDYFISNRLSIGFNTSFRYDLITDIVDFDDGVSNANNDLIFGYHLNFEYYFSIFKKGELTIEIGVSWLNRNTSFSLSEPDLDENGERIGTVISTLDYSYSANKISVSYSLRKSKFRLGTYVTNNSGYFQETTTFWVPFVNYSYTFGKL